MLGKNIFYSIKQKNIGKYRKKCPKLYKYRKYRILIKNIGNIGTAFKPVSDVALTACRVAVMRRRIQNHEIMERGLDEFNLLLNY